MFIELKKNPRQTVIQVWVPSARRPWGLASPWGSCTISNHQASGGGGGVVGCLPNLAGCLPQLPTVLGAKRTKFPPLPPGEKGLVPSSRAMGRMGHWPGSPRGQCILNGGSRRGLLKLCSGYLSPTSPHHRRDLRGQLGGLAQSSH